MKQSLFKDKKGLSIIQVLVAAGIASIMSLGIMQMIENTRRAQRRSSLLGTLADMQDKIRNQLVDQGSFAMTVNNNNGAPFVQLKNAVSVTENALTAPNKFILFDATNNLAYDLLGPSDSAGPYNGFTERGNPCSNFYASAGNGRDDCPFSYRMLVAADCPRAGIVACTDPQLRFVARLVYNPSSAGSSTLNLFRGLVPQVSGTNIQTTLQAGAYNEGKYDVMVNRTATTVTRSFFISASVSATPATACNTGASTPTGGGTCSVGDYALHPLTGTVSGGSGWERESDPANLVTVVPTSGYFTFNETGYYRCTAQAKAFGTNLAIKIYNATAPADFGNASGIALDNYSEANVRLDTAFEVSNTSHRHYLYQRCTSATFASCSLGFAKADYSDLDSKRLVSISCEKLDTAY